MRIESRILPGVRGVASGNTLRRALATVVAAGFVAVFAPPSSAADPAVVETLMRDTGLWKTLGEIEPGILRDLHANIAEAPKKPEKAELQRLERLISASFKADRLRAIARDTIAENLGDEDVPTLQNWLSSADGKLITKLEDSLPRDHAATEKAKRDGAIQLEKMSEARRDLIEDIVVAMRLTEMTADIAIQSTLIALGAIRRARPDIPVPSEYEAKARMQAGRARAERQMTATFLEVLASGYKKLSDAQLRGYEEMLTSKSGRRATDAFNDAIAAAMADATEHLWKDLIPPDKPAASET